MSLQNPTTALHTVLTGCPRCRCLLIRALDAPVAALDVRLDPEPLTEAGELTALLTGCMTYDVFPIGGHHEIAHRDQWRMKKRKYPVLATHRCPGRIPATAAALFRPLPKKGEHNARPQF